MSISLEYMKKCLFYSCLFLSTGFLIIFVSCQEKYQEFSAPINLRCEYQSSPLGIDVLQPRLSWYVNDNRRGAIQSAYQIIVARSGEILEEDVGDVWDSGKVISDQSVHVPYQGPALESRQRYYWKVRTWDNNGEPSPYSETAWWEMGILSQEEWQAKWVGKAIKKKEIKPTWPWGFWIWHLHEKGIDIPVFFRKTFKVQEGKAITNAVIRTTADNYFTAYINGREVGNGSAWTEVYEFNVKPYITSVENIIAVRAANNLGDICGMICSLKIEFEDGTFVVINSDKSWKTSAVSQEDWEQIDFNDADWSEVHVIEKYGGSQWGKIDPWDIYIPPRSVYVRKEFEIQKKIERARAYVTGLGNYILHINGQRVGKDVFTPGWTDYPQRIQYQTYDVTSLMKQGTNALGALLGNMWWSSGLGWRGSVVYSEGPLRFMMQLVIDYTDDSMDVFITDNTWKTHDSPLVENSLYHGETYDARLEMPGWDEAEFDDVGWETVLLVERSKARLVAQQGPTIQIIKEIKPVKITEVDSGIFVFNMGQNMVGWGRLNVSGTAGTTVRLRFAEVLQDNGHIYTKNLRGAKATDTYILKGQGKESWEPNFTYHGFRYVEVSGYPGTPGLEAITGKVVHSAVPEIGHFACSNDLLNKIQKNITWGQRGNMHSVPTDCPQRDERLGWMGDAQIFAPTASYNMNMARFFSKWMRDIIDCQDADGAVHDVNPAIVVQGPAKPGWGDAVIVIPWVVYNFYGDKRIIEENYDGMAAWVAYMQEHSKGLLYERSGYGDWIAVVESPKEPIGAAYFYYCAKLMAKMAFVVDKSEDSQKYNQLAQKIAAAFNEKFLDKTTNQYQGATQTANLLPLMFGITPDEFKRPVAENIIKDVVGRNNHPSTGFLGTAYLLPALSTYDKHDLAYQVATQKSYPSWGYMVENEATTIWELWNSDSKGPEMNSRNHFALGSIGEWFYGWLTGIQSDPQHPGFKRIIIAPKPSGDLSWVSGGIETMYGPVESRWEIELVSNTRG